MTENIAHHLRTRAESEPRRRAVVCPAGRDRGGRVRYAHLTFAQLEEASDSLARGLNRIGVGPGSRVALLVRPSLDFFSLVFALAKTGAVLVLVDPGIGPLRVGRCLAEAAPTVFAGIPIAHLARIALRWSPQSIDTLITVGRRWGWGGHRLADLFDESPEPFPIVDPDPDARAGIFFTSGSTGPPKGVVYTHDIFSAQIEFLREYFQVAGNEIDLPTFPPFALFDPALGLTAIVPDMDASNPGRADPARLVEAIQDQGVSQIFGSPALVDLLGRYALERGLRLETVRRVLSAGAPVRPDVIDRLARVIHPDAHIYTPYGATEALPVATIEGREIMAETRFETARGRGVCVGRPVRQVSVRIIRITDEPISAWSDELEVPQGEVGEIVVRGPIVTQTYHGREEADAAAKIPTEDGRMMHRMGDLGRLDAKGRLWFYGRKAHRVRTRGGVLFPVACEGIVNENPNVLRSALVGIGQAGEEEPVLLIEVEADATRRGEDLRRDILEVCRSEESLSAVQRVLFHPGFPVDRRHNAKIDRPMLAQWVARGGR